MPEPSSAIGQRKEECGALSFFGLDPDGSPVLFDDLLANGQAYSSPRIRGRRLEALKDAKDSLRVLGCDADAVIPDCEAPLSSNPLRRHVDARGGVPSKLDPVADQVLQELTHLVPIGQNCW
jgi:hypothetical protein